jgi:hypothetical protein
VSSAWQPARNSRPNRTEARSRLMFENLSTGVWWRFADWNRPVAWSAHDERSRKRKRAGKKARFNRSASRADRSHVPTARDGSIAIGGDTR